MQSARLFVKVSGLSANVMLFFANVSRLFAIVTRLFAKQTRYISKVHVFFGTRAFGKCHCVLIPRDTRCFVKVSCNVVKVTRLSAIFFFLATKMSPLAMYNEIGMLRLYFEKGVL